jgi:hypothetical protein
MAAPALAEEPPAPDVSSAPLPHQASGRLRDHHRDEGAMRRLGNVLLWGPRQLLELGLWAPDLLVAQVDNYLDSKGPNVYNRGSSGGGWGGGAMLAWEAPFGPSIGARIERGFGRRLTADLTGVAFGRHGFTGRLGLALELRREVAVEMAAEYAHDREVAFAGIGDHMPGGGTDLDPFAPGPVPEVILDDRPLVAKLQTPIDLGRLRLQPSVRYERHEVAPDDEDSFPFDPSGLRGFGDPFALGTGRLDLTWDARDAPYPWIPRAAPASGWRVLASAGYSLGSDETGDFQLARLVASGERLFDLFHGTRVLILRGKIDGVTADRREVPFLLLPSLGGPDELRAFSRGRFRDEIATSGEIEYEWAVGLNARASIFVELGGVHEGLGEMGTDALHFSSGGSFRFAYDDGTGARAVVAGSSTGELGFFLILGGV